LPKIILITHEFAPFRGGVATYCAEAARAGAALGEAVEVWAPGLVGTTAEHGVTVCRLGGRCGLRPGPLLGFAGAIFRRRHALRGARVVLGSVGAQMIFLHLRALGLLRGVEAVPLFHGSEVLRYGRNVWLRRLARWGLAECAEIVAASEGSARLVAESGLAPGREVRVAPCGLRHDLREAALLPWGERSPGPLRVLTLARVHPRKGQLDTARALALLPEEVRRNLVYQVGGGGDEAYLREVEAACAAGGVPFAYLGEIADENLAAAYAGCDVYAMSSRILPRSIEGFGMTYLEAAAFGKPSVGYRTGGVAEAVENGRTGILVAEGYLDGLSAALGRLLIDAALRQTMGEAARAAALRRTWDAAARVLFAL
jgi:phosphatidylinositol alpha-1,6-mannosyltransferase